MQRDPVSSTTLKSVGYDDDLQILELEFVHGGVYQYLDVPTEEYAELMNADSLGSHFSHNIRGVYEYKEVDEKVKSLRLKV